MRHVSACAHHDASPPTARCRGRHNTVGGHEDQTPLREVALVRPLRGDLVNDVRTFQLARYRGVRRNIPAAPIPIRPGPLKRLLVGRAGYAVLCCGSRQVKNQCYSHKERAHTLHWRGHCAKQPVTNDATPIRTIRRAAAVVTNIHLTCSTHLCRRSSAIQAHRSPIHTRLRAEEDHAGASVQSSRSRVVAAGTGGRGASSRRVDAPTRASG